MRRCCSLNGIIVAFSIGTVIAVDGWASPIFVMPALNEQATVRILRCLPRSRPEISGNCCSGEFWSTVTVDQRATTPVKMVTLSDARRP